MNDMKLPTGATCRDCQAFQRCTHLVGRQGHETECDWSPSAYRPLPGAPTSVVVCRLCGEQPAVLCEGCREYLEETTDLAYAETFDNVKAEYESALVTLMDAAAEAEDWARELFGCDADRVTIPLAAAIERGIAAMPAGSWVRPNGHED